jgi:hypothetical protein
MRYMTVSTVTKRPSQWRNYVKNNGVFLDSNHELKKMCDVKDCIDHFISRQKKRKREDGNGTEETKVVIPPSKLEKETQMYIMKYLLERGEKDEETGCLNWTGCCSPDGYGVHSISGKDCRVHRTAWELGNECVPPKDFVICHSCGNRKCFNIEHLKIGTQSENMKDKELHGTANSGRNHPKATIDEETAMKIFKAKGTKRQQEIADEFGVSLYVVSDIHSGGSWNSVTNMPKKKYEVTRRRLTTEEDYARARQYVENRVEKKDDHWLWKNSTIRGYVHANFLGYNYSSHILSMMAFSKQQIPEGIQVRHKCREKSCCSPEHLELGTPKENAADRVRDGTALIGERHPNYKVTPELERAIYDSKGSGTQEERGKRFGISLTTISIIDQKHLKM